MVTKRCECCRRKYATGASLVRPGQTHEFCSAPCALRWNTVHPAPTLKNELRFDPP